MQNKTLTIMFVDMQGYTSLTADQTREEHQWFIKEINSFIQKHVEAKHGALIKTMGDGFLITFESPTDAITCGMGIQEEIKRRNASMFHENHLLRLRIGVSTGEVTVTDENDVYGEAVNIAARIEKFCEPNEIFISESTYLAMNKSEIKTKDLGPLKFKNISDDIRVFKVLKDGKPGSARRAASWRRFPFIYPVALLGLLIAAALGIYFFSKSKPHTAMPRPVSFPETEHKNPLEGCQDDVRKFCAEIRPGGGRIIRCLQDHAGEIGKECTASLNTARMGPEPFSMGAPPHEIQQSPGDFSRQSEMQGGRTPDPQLISQRQQLKESCAQDIQTYCAHVQRGGGRMMKCLKEHGSEISPACSESLEHMAPVFSSASANG